MLNSKEEQYWEYDVSLLTQLGPRTGKLFLRIIGNMVEGIVEILGKQQACRGMLNDRGLWELKGTLCTLVSNFDYEAQGFINEQNVDLELQYKRGKLRLLGKRLKR